MEFFNVNNIKFLRELNSVDKKFGAGLATMGLIGAGRFNLIRNTIQKRYLHQEVPYPEYMKEYLIKRERFDENTQPIEEELTLLNNMKANVLKILFCLEIVKKDQIVVAKISEYTIKDKEINTIFEEVIRKLYLELWKEAQLEGNYFYPNLLQNSFEKTENIGWYKIRSKYLELKKIDVQKGTYLESCLLLDLYTLSNFVNKWFVTYYNIRVNESNNKIRLIQYNALTDEITFQNNKINAVPLPGTGIKGHLDQYELVECILMDLNNFMETFISLYKPEYTFFSDQNFRSRSSLDYINSEYAKIIKPYYHHIEQYFLFFLFSINFGTSIGLTRIAEWKNLIENMENTNEFPYGYPLVIQDPDEDDDEPDYIYVCIHRFSDAFHRFLANNADIYKKQMLICTVKLREVSKDDIIAFKLNQQEFLLKHLPAFFDQNNSMTKTVYPEYFKRYIEEVRKEAGIIKTEKQIQEELTLLNGLETKELKILGCLEILADDEMSNQKDWEARGIFQESKKIISTVRNQILRILLKEALLQGNYNYSESLGGVIDVKNLVINDERYLTDLYNLRSFINKLFIQYSNVRYPNNKIALIDYNVITRQITWLENKRSKVEPNNEIIIRDPLLERRLNLLAYYLHELLISLFYEYDYNAYIHYINGDFTHDSNVDVESWYDLYRYHKWLIHLTGCDAQGILLDVNSWNQIFHLCYESLLPNVLLPTVLDDFISTWNTFLQHSPTIDFNQLILFNFSVR